MNQEPASQPSLDDLVARSRVVLCCGTGGVGKTTTAAALAVRAARSGRRCVVVTIDPARRLADALGVTGHGDELVRVDVEGTTAGELWVTMLDPKATFDRLIRSHAADGAQAERILANRYYRNLSSGLSGTHEFMAVERLHELHTDDRFDLVIVDTPPSRNALDVLDAPDRLARFLDGRVFRLATSSGPLTRTLTAPLLVVLRRVSRAVSPEVVDDTLAFIESFSGMEAGFRSRAGAVDAMLGAPSTAFVLVAAPTAEAADESRVFIDRLTASGRSVAALVLNRVHAVFATDAVPTAMPQVADPGVGIPSRLEDTRAMLDDLRTLQAAESAAMAPLVSACANAIVVRIPDQEDEVADLAAVTSIADLMS